MKIVVIEDEIRIREGIGRLLHKLDEEYELAGDSREREGRTCVDPGLEAGCSHYRYQDAGDGRTGNADGSGCRRL